MRTKRLLGAAAAIVVVMAAATLAYAYWPTSTRSIAASPKLDDPAVVEAGRYVAVASDCVACHTAPGGKPFAGGLRMETPVGAIYASNITPDADTGIGRYSLDEFDRLVRHGLLPDGRTAYPAMPYPSYSKLTDEDVAALYAYFMKGVQPVRQENKSFDIPFPLSMNWPLAIWRKTFAPTGDDAAFEAARYRDEQVARGAYLVQAAGHCGTCHTPRAITLQEEGLDERSPKYLSGGQVIDGWFAVSLRNQPDGLASWTREDIVATLKTGRNPRRAVIGSPMNDVVVHSGQHMRDDDLAAIAAYLKTLGPETPSRRLYAADDTTANALKAGRETSRGAELYVDNCAACHRTNGGGDLNGLPAIAGNSTVLANDPTSLIRVILAGARMAPTKERPASLGMPGFAWRLSDQETADLVTFIRTSFGNRAEPASAEMVRNVRSGLPQEANEAHVGAGAQPNAERH